MTARPDIAKARRIVVKIGSALLVDRTRGLRTDWLAGLALDVAAARNRKADVILVSSGAIALGRMVLGLPAGALAVEQSQAAAAVGQIRLARAYEEVLAPHGITTAQILVTLEDTEDRRRYLNSRATMETLLGLGVVPIVNENDTVATDEIRYGDNDRLAAQIAVTIGADALVLLSAMWTGSTQPTRTRMRRATRFDVVDRITPEIEAMAGDPVSGLSKGGMKTKLMAAKTAVAGGCAMAIMEGSVRRPLKALADGADLHLVHRAGRPAGRAQALDRGDEAARRDHGGCRRGHGAARGQVAAARRCHACRGQLRARRPGGDPVAGRRAAGAGPDPLYGRRGEGHRRAAVG